MDPLVGTDNFQLSTLFKSFIILVHCLNFSHMVQLINAHVGGFITGVFLKTGGAPTKSVTIPVPEDWCLVEDGDVNCGMCLECQE